jgi:hypothetical protein
MATGDKSKIKLPEDISEVLNPFNHRVTDLKLGLSHVTINQNPDKSDYLVIP